MNENFDVIGDVHGQSEALIRLLDKLGYERQDETTPFKHPDGRTAIFVGDLIDRGKTGFEVAKIAMLMTQAGSAITVMGSHELNAILFHDKRKLRPHTDKNREQHQAFLDQMASDPETGEGVIAWFKTLPLYYEHEGFRVVHACWGATTKDYLDSVLDDQQRLPENSYADAADTSHKTFHVVEKWLKGDEQTLPHGLSYLDKGGHERKKARLQWWMPDGSELDELALLQGDPVQKAAIRERLKGHVPEARVLYDNEKPVFIGHYWMTGKPSVKTESVCCVDYSAGKGDKLCAYQWGGEKTLFDDKFVYVSVEIEAFG